MSSYLNKEVEKEKPDSRELNKVFCLKPQPPTEERVLIAFLVRLWVMSKSKVSHTITEDLIGLCETVANQLHQSKGCCGVSHVPNPRELNKVFFLKPQPPTEERVLAAFLVRLWVL